MGAMVLFEALGASRGATAESDQGATRERPRRGISRGGNLGGGDSAGSASKSRSATATRAERAARSVVPEKSLEVLPFQLAARFARGFCSPLVRLEIQRGRFTVDLGSDFKSPPESETARNSLESEASLDSPTSESADSNGSATSAGETDSTGGLVSSAVPAGTWRERVQVSGRAGALVQEGCWFLSADALALFRTLRGESVQFEVRADRPSFSGADLLTVDAPTGWREIVHPRKLLETTGLLAALSEASRFTGTKTRYAFDSVLIESGENGSSVVATDGAMLYRRRLPAQAGVSTVLVPVSRAFQAFSGQPCRMSQTSSTLTFVTDRITWAIAISTGRFPLYQEALKNLEGQSVVLDAVALPLFREQLKAIGKAEQRLEIEFKPGWEARVIFADGRSLRLPLIHSTTLEAKMAFQPRRLLEALTPTGVQEIVVPSAKSAPLRFQGENLELLLMPCA